MKNCYTGKDPDAGQDWRQEEKGMTEDETAGWHHGLDGHEFEEALGVGDGQEAWLAAVQGVAKKLDTTKWLNWTEMSFGQVWQGMAAHHRLLQMNHNERGYI